MIPLNKSESNEIIRFEMKSNIPTGTKSEKISFSIPKDDYDWLAHQTEETGATVQGIIRMLIRKARKAEAAA